MQNPYDQVATGSSGSNASNPYDDIAAPPRRVRQPRSTITGNVPPPVDPTAAGMKVEPVKPANLLTEDEIHARKGTFQQRTESRRYWQEVRNSQRNHIPVTGTDWQAQTRRRRQIHHAPPEAGGVHFTQDTRPEPPKGTPEHDEWVRTGGGGLVVNRHMTPEEIAKLRDEEADPLGATAFLHKHVGEPFGNLMFNVADTLGLSPSLDFRDQMTRVGEGVPQMAVDTVYHPAETAVQLAAMEVGGTAFKAAVGKISSLIAERAASKTINQEIVGYLAKGGNVDDLLKEEPKARRYVQQVQRSPDFKSNLEGPSVDVTKRGREGRTFGQGPNRVAEPGLKEEPRPVAEPEPPKSKPKKRATKEQAEQAAEEFAGPPRPIEEPKGTTHVGGGKFVETSGDVSPSQTGISQGVHEARGMDVQPGTGTSAPEQIEAARQRIASGEDPVAKMEAFKAGRLPPTPELQAEFRVHAETLAKATRDALNESPEAFNAAKAKETQWLQDMKPIATQASEVFRGLQGVTDLDTGDWAALASKAAESYKRPVTPEELETLKAQATRLSGVVSQHEATIARQGKQIEDLLNKKATQELKTGRTGGSRAKRPDDLASYFAAKAEDGSLFTKGRERTGSIGGTRGPAGVNFTPDERRWIWEHVKKNYLDNRSGYFEGHISLDAIAERAGRDLNLDPDWVKQVIAEPKSQIAELSNAQLISRANRRNAIRDAKIWAENAGNSSSAEWLSKLWNGWRGAKTFGHGTVWPVTHVGMGNFDPFATGSGVRGFVNSVRAQFSVASHEGLIERMMRKPDFQFKVDSGLRIGEGDLEDFQKYANVFGKISQAGNRAMDMLRVYRDEAFDRIWESMPEDLKATPEGRKELGKLVADQANHESGTISARDAWGKAEGAVKNTMFGPNLWRARWARMVGDPIKTVRAFAGGTPVEKAVASYRMKRFGRISATYIGGTLGANYLWLKSQGVKDENNVNFLDPTKPDWLKPKDLAGHAYAFDGGLLRVPQLLYSEADLAAQAGFSGWKDIEALGHVDTHQNKKTEAINRAGSFLTSGLAPQLQPIGDVLSGQDFQGRPMPWATQAEKDKAALAGKPPLTWAEYGLDKFGPIPVEGLSASIYEGFREDGKEGPMWQKIAKAMAEGITGVRDVPPSKRPQPTEFDKFLKGMGMDHPMKQDYAGGETLEQFKARKQSFDAFALPYVQKVKNSPEYKAERSRTARTDMVKDAIKEATSDWNDDHQDDRDQRSEHKKTAHDKQIEKERATD